MKTQDNKTDGMPFRLAGPGLISLLGREDERTVSALRRRLAQWRRRTEEPFQKPAGPRHD
jgi:hypothetical protein